VVQIRTKVAHQLSFLHPPFPPLLLPAGESEETDWTCSLKVLYKNATARTGTLVSLLVSAREAVGCFSPLPKAKVRCRKLEILDVSGFPVPGYHVDGYIRASGFVLYPVSFVLAPTNTIVLVVHGCAEISDMA